MAETDLFERASASNPRWEQEERGERGRTQTHEVSPLSPDPLRRMHSLSNPKMTRERLNSKTINHEGLQPRLLLLPPPIYAIHPVLHLLPQRPQRDVLREDVPALVGNVGDVAYVGELRVEEEAEAGVGRGRGGEEFAVVDCEGRALASRA